MDGHWADHHVDKVQGAVDRAKRQRASPHRLLIVRASRIVMLVV